LGKDALTQFAFELPVVIVPPLTFGALTVVPAMATAPLLVDAVGAGFAPAVVVALAPGLLAAADLAALAEPLGIAAVACEPGITATPEESGCADTPVALSACGCTVDSVLDPGTAIKSTMTASSPPTVPTETSSQRRWASSAAIRRGISFALPADADFTGDWLRVFVVM
jgi:hypothetical protein